MSYSAKSLFFSIQFYLSFLVSNLFAPLGVSIPIQSDSLPEVLEEKAMEAVRSRLSTTSRKGNNKFNMSTVVDFLAKKDIYTTSQNARERVDNNVIDYTKLKGEIEKTPHRKLLLDNSQYGIEVVAYFIRQYKQLQTASRLIDNFHKGESSKTKARKRKSTTKAAEGAGGEIFHMFTFAQNKCVLDQTFIDTVTEIAETNSNTNYYAFTNNGTTWFNSVEKDIQPHLDAFYNGHKSQFSCKRLYGKALDHMEVYIKLMYCVQRGLIAPIVASDQKYVNVYWGEVGNRPIARALVYSTNYIEYYVLAIAMHCCSYI